MGRVFVALCHSSVGRALNHYFFYVPEVRLVFEPLTLLRDSVRLHIFVNFAIIGVAYFLNLNVAFSVWFFHLLSRFQTGVFNVIGFQIKGHNEALTGSSIALSHQGDGGDVGAGGGAILWTARGHLRQVFGAAFKRGVQADDGDEILSYRAAVWLWIVCAVYFLGWLLLSGVPVVAAVVFFLRGVCHFPGHCAGHCPRRRGLYLFDYAAAALCSLYLGHGCHRLEGADVDQPELFVGR